MSKATDLSHLNDLTDLEGITDGTNGQVLTTDGSGTFTFEDAAGGDLVDDTTPQLGGDLDLNSSDITGTGNINITGTVTADGLTVDTDTLYVDSTNNRVGIGTTSPDATGVHIHTGTAGSLTPNAAADDLVVESNGNAGITIASPDANYSGIIFSSPTDTTGSIIEYNQSGATFDIGTATSGGVLRLRSGSFSEAMRIDSDGDVLIGSSTNVGTGDHKVSVDIGTAGRALGLRTSVTSAKILCSFVNGNGTVGSIQTNGSGTSYVTSSDYRLKENAVAISDGITRVKQLQPKRFNFIADNSTTVDGFMAHEAQAVVPEAATGTKDAVDDEGNPDYQGIDQAKLVPLLTAALQEAIAKIETLETKVAALKAN